MKEDVRKGMGIAAKLFGLTEHKGYIKKNDKQVKWEGSAIENKTISDKLMMQNEYWAAKCLERGVLFICNKTAGQDKPAYLKYKQYSKSNKLPAIYKNARSLSEFIKSGATEGTLLLMNFQLESQSKGTRFYVVEVPFSGFNKGKGTLKSKAGDVTIKISGNSVTVTARGKTFNNVPMGAFWIVWKDKNIENVVLAKRAAKKLKKRKDSGYIPQMKF